jgi:hypothetical protein
VLAASNVSSCSKLPPQPRHASSVRRLAGAHKTIVANAYLVEELPESGGALSSVLFRRLASRSRSLLHLQTMLICAHCQKGGRSAHVPVPTREGVTEERCVEVADVRLSVYIEYRRGDIYRLAVCRPERQPDSCLVVGRSGSWSVLEPVAAISRGPSGW